MAGTSSMNRRILLLGAGGMIGSALARRFGSSTVAAFQHEELDITDYGAVEKAFIRFKPEIVFNAAAFTRVDDCEKFRETAFLVNAQAPGHLAHLCRRYDAFLVHFSTDYVFSGFLQRPYREEDPPEPINYYGISKWEGDRMIFNSGCSYLIVRTSWIFGKGGDNFVKKILKRALAGARLVAPVDQSGCPTYADDVSEAVQALLEKGASGLYHFASSGSCSRYEQAQMILKLYGLNNPVEAATNDTLSMPARRPRYSVLDTGKYRKATGKQPRSWQESTADYIAFLKENENELRS